MSLFSRLLTALKGLHAVDWLVIFLITSVFALSVYRMIGGRAVSSITREFKEVDCEIKVKSTQMDLKDKISEGDEVRAGGKTYVRVEKKVITGDSMEVTLFVRGRVFAEGGSPQYADSVLVPGEEFYVYTEKYKLSGIIVESRLK